jgi:hypothetical protein
MLPERDQQGADDLGKNEIATEKNFIRQLLPIEEVETMCNARLRPPPN